MHDLIHDLEERPSSNVNMAFENPYMTFNFIPIVTSIISYSDFKVNTY